jgi:hypothetical protein
MTRSELPAHWRFAAGQALAGLRELVCAFDFARLADGHTYAGLEPSSLEAVIDGFLGEPEGVIFGGDRAELQRLRQLLVEYIVPAHEQGLAEGRRRWREGDHVYGSLPTDELHRLALELAPVDDKQRGWFAEGFCFAYSFEELESLRSEMSAEQGAAADRRRE